MKDPLADGCAEGKFFAAHQRATIEAATARLIPADDQPGAREAGTIDFLERYLSGLDFIYAKPDGSGFEKLAGKRAEAWQQRVEIPPGAVCRGCRGTGAQSQSQLAQSSWGSPESSRTEFWAAWTSLCSGPKSQRMRPSRPNPRCNRRTQRSSSTSFHC